MNGKSKQSQGYVNEAFTNCNEGDLETVDLNDNGSDDGNYQNGQFNDIEHNGSKHRRENGVAFHRHGTSHEEDNNFVAIHLEAGSPLEETSPGVGVKGLIGEESNGGVEDTARCGILMLRPGWLQKFRTAKWALFWLCWTGALQGMVVNGFVNVVITTIERRFGLRSSQTGLVAGGYDLASFLCLVPVTYLGGRKGARKPRWLGWGAVIMGLGSLVFSLPHFAASQYKAPSGASTQCQRVANISQYDSGCSSSEALDSAMGGSSTGVLMVFLLAQFLHGAGASPLFTLGVTYIDENVSKKMSSVYLGIFYTMSIIGPAVGYVLGGQLLQIYTDFYFVDPSELGLTPDSNVWIGAWWIGFLLSALLCFTVAVPLLAFPPSLPGSAELQKERVSEAYDGDSSRTEAFSKIREMPKAFTALIKNPTFFFLNLAGATEGMLLSGFAAFLPKVIENQFSITASWAAILMGMVTVPAGGGGTFFGGYLVKRLNLQCAGIIKLCVWSTLAAILFSGGFFLSCPNLAFAGLTQAYSQNTPWIEKTINLESSCNQGCSCLRSLYDPVCGIDGVMYFSPCYAGCTQETTVEGSKAYKTCACVKSPASIMHDTLTSQDNTTSVNTTKHDIGLTLNSNSSMMMALIKESIPYQAVNTMCESSCPYLYIFMVLAFGMMFFTFLATMPALSATLRCVRDDQRSFALGIQWIKVRLLGTIPAPLIFGVLIDKSCTLWQQSCDGKGACLVYNNSYMSRYMLALALIAKAGSLLFFFLAWWFYKAPQHSNIISQTVPSVNLVQNQIKQNNHTHSNGCANNDGISEHL